jgi:hypothetical protein
VAKSLDRKGNPSSAALGAQTTIQGCRCGQQIQSMAVKIARDQPRNDPEKGTVLCFLIHRAARRHFPQHSNDERRG